MGGVLCCFKKKNKESEALLTGAQSDDLSSIEITHKSTSSTHAVYPASAPVSPFSYVSTIPSSPTSTLSSPSTQPPSGKTPGSTSTSTPAPIAPHISLPSSQSSRKNNPRPTPVSNILFASDSSRHSSTSNSPSVTSSTSESSFTSSPTPIFPSTSDSASSNSMKSLSSQNNLRYPSIPTPPTSSSVQSPKISTKKKPVIIPNTTLSPEDQYARVMTQLANVVLKKTKRKPSPTPVKTAETKTKKQPPPVPQRKSVSTPFSPPPLNKPSSLPVPAKITEKKTETKNQTPSVHVNKPTSTPVKVKPEEKGIPLKETQTPFSPSEPPSKSPLPVTAKMTQKKTETKNQPSDKKYPIPSATKPILTPVKMEREEKETKAKETQGVSEGVSELMDYLTSPECYLLNSVDSINHNDLRELGEIFPTKGTILVYCKYLEHKGMVFDRVTKLSKAVRKLHNDVDEVYTILTNKKPPEVALFPPNANVQITTRDARNVFMSAPANPIPILNQFVAENRKFNSLEDLHHSINAVEKKQNMSETKKSTDQERFMNARQKTDLKRCDSIALNATPSDEKDLDTLVKYLTKLLDNDFDKSRVIFRWITDRITYDLEGYLAARYGHTDSQNVLQKRSTVCEGYANLYLDMCKKAELKVVKISGYAKGYSYSVENKFSQKNHAWNAIQLGGQWYLLDPTWASGHARGRTHIKEFCEHYYLTPPEQFITSHFPDDSKYQFMIPPMKMEDYLNQVKLYSTFFELGLYEVIPNEAVLHKNDSFIVEMKGPENVEFIAVLDPEDGQKKYTWIESEGKNHKIIVHPPEKGTYELKIFGKPKGKPGYSSILMIYKVYFEGISYSLGEFVTPYGLSNGKNFRIFTPKLKELRCIAQPMEFKLRIPDAKEMRLTDHYKRDTRVLPSQNPDIFIFTGTFPKGNLLITANYGGSSWHYLAKYEVVLDIVVE